MRTANFLFQVSKAILFVDVERERKRSNAFAIVRSSTASFLFTNQVTKQFSNLAWIDHRITNLIVRIGSRQISKFNLEPREAIE